jgi:hypothetical protein
MSKYAPRNPVAPVKKISFYCQLFSCKRRRDRRRERLEGREERGGKGEDTGRRVCGRISIKRRLYIFW